MIADEYRQMLLALLPRGDAWPKDKDSEQSKLMGAWSHEFARVDSRAADLRREMNPATATEMLDEWEASHGLPDYCTTVPTTPEDRRTALMARRLEGHPYHPGDYLAKLVALGADPAVIEELLNHPWLTGVGACGDALWSDEWMYVWSIVSSGPHDPALVCSVKRNVQSHTYLQWRWSQLLYSAPEVQSPTEPFHAIAFGGTTGIAVGSAGLFARSTVAGTWVISDVSDASPGDVNWRAVASDGAGNWVAVGQTVVGALAMQAVSDDDGATWTVGPIEVSAINIGSGVNGIGFGNGVWIVCKGTGNVYVSDDDGDTWSVEALSGATQVDFVRYDTTASRWFATGTRVHVSDDDGDTWTQTAAFAGAIGTAVARVGAQMVAIAGSGTVGAFVNTVHVSDDDGDTWTSQGTILPGRIVIDLIADAVMGATVMTYTDQLVPSVAARMSGSLLVWEDQPVSLWRAAFGRNRLYGVGGEIISHTTGGLLGLPADRIYAGDLIT